MASVSSARSSISALFRLWHPKCIVTTPATRWRKHNEMNNYRILIVDEAETMRLSHKLFLSDKGYSVETAGDAGEAWNKIEAFGPELILLDAMMPSKDGIECCRRIKSNEGTREIKVVVISPSTDYERISEAFAAGCDDYVIKPLDRAELLLTIKDILKF